MRAVGFRGGRTSGSGWSGCLPREKGPPSTRPWLALPAIEYFVQVMDRRRRSCPCRALTTRSGPIPRPRGLDIRVKASGCDLRCQHQWIHPRITQGHSDLRSLCRSTARPRRSFGRRTLLRHGWSSSVSSRVGGGSRGGVCMCDSDVAFSRRLSDHVHRLLAAFRRRSLLEAAKW